MKYVYFVCFDGSFYARCDVGGGEGAEIDISFAVHATENRTQIYLFIFYFYKYYFLLFRILDGHAQARDVCVEPVVIT